jgi:hypothetical protein
MSAGRKARGGVAFRVVPPAAPPADRQCIACAIVAAVVLWFALVFGGMHLAARFLP